ncbi:adenylate and guanylate cyclase catalytic domain-containing protein, putative [Eimeria brunetti]|uniref:adenylate cyclase n=1 Tax=Eimeria brunetti TaxID=51314 RepID=U6LLW3_9EIME|nr:adenylate and guanylate cyclase catalytic domain-containing protein, putative [Eimeria brunetti]
MLQKLFAKFDRDSTKYKLYKLCTIGDAYVAVSEPVTEDNQDYDPVEGTSLVLRMAQSMISNILDVRERLNIPNLNMRIGLHYGTCVGGVIGSGRLRYDLWGMDVLTGNMMESNGQPGKVNVSAVLKDFLVKHFPGKFKFRFNKTVCVIDKTVDSYIIYPAGEGPDDEAAAGQGEGSSSGPRRDESRRKSRCPRPAPKTETGRPPQGLHKETKGDKRRQRRQKETKETKGDRRRQRRQEKEKGKEGKGRRQEETEGGGRRQKETAEKERRQQTNCLLSPYLCLLSPPNCLLFGD